MSIATIGKVLSCALGATSLPTTLVGNYYEFGVYQGDRLAASYQCYQQFCEWLDHQTRSGEAWRRELAKPYLARHPFQFVGLDTFSGMPDNDEGERIFAKGTFAGSLRQVEQRCAAVGLRSRDLILVPGLFAETKATVAAMAPTAIINMDGDLYQSAVDALEASIPLIQQGTVLLCDDCNAFAARRDAGERRALAEWTERTGIVVEPWFSYHFSDQAFFCHL